MQNECPPSIIAFILSGGSMLQSQVVLVTGASHGIGLATVEQLAKAGCQVYAGTRDPSKAEKLQELASRVNNISIQQLDITSDDSVKKVVSDIVEKEGKISALVNNAGFGMFGTVDMHSINDMHAWRADWKTMMDKGQNATEIAEVIQSALEDRDPKFWYQTSHSVTESIGKHFKDLTGKIRIPVGLPVAAARK